MTRIIMLLLIISPAILFGQQTRLITDRNKKESYYVLKSDKSIKHGDYKKLNFNNSVQIIGHFKNGTRDSIWQFFDYKGVLQQKYDYSRNELVYYKVKENNDDNIFRVISGQDTTEILLDRPPLYIGSESVMRDILNERMRYPQEAVVNGISGAVIISFIIDKNGKTSNHKVSVSVGYGCDEEALRVVQYLPDNWLPGLLNGHPVDLEFKVPIRFILQ